MLFGQGVVMKIPKKERMILVGCRISKETDKKLGALAKKNKVSKSECLRFLLEKGLKKQTDL